MLQIGNYNRLEIVKLVPFGAYLEAEGFGEILIPKKYLPLDAEKGMMLDVFVYLDSEDRIIATTLKPFGTVGEFAWLKIVELSKFGAFADWGLEKDLFIPFREQIMKPEPGKSFLTYIYLDEHSGRIAGSHKYLKFLQDFDTTFEENQSVDILIIEKTPIGYKALIDNQAIGIVYENEIYNSKIKSGSKTKAFIKKVREDGKIDLSLHKPGYDTVVDFSSKVLEYLQEKGGFITLNDKSSPELIYEAFGVSKKIFKKAIGKLYKEGKVKLTKDGVELLS